jgi:hypothetical protein
MDNDQLGYYNRQIEIARNKYNKTLFKLNQLNYILVRHSRNENSFLMTADKYDEILDYKNKLENKLEHLQNTIYFMSRNAYNYIINNHEWNMWTSKTII